MTDRLEVIPVTGTGLEPEEAPTRRVQTLPLEIGVGSSPFASDRSVVRTGVVPITTEMPASEVATLLLARCGRCVHFRSDHWEKLRTAWATQIGTKGRRELEAMIDHLVKATKKGEITDDDRKRAAGELAYWGVCDALTEDRNDVVIVHPAACCPGDVAYYRDRDSVAKREASAAYDSVMRAAQGRG